MNAEHIQRTAADWFARRIGDSWTPRDEAEFDRWIDADIAHRIQYVRIEAAWQQAGRLKPLRAPKRFGYFALAASVILCVLASGYVFFDYFKDTHYTTAVGATDTVPLEDGSHITLNTDTSIHVDLGRTERRIDLEKGEAYFEVAPDPRRPFIVQAGHQRIIVIGTRFSVRRDRDDVQVAVTEGKVRLEGASAQRPAPARPELRDRSAKRESSGGSAVLLTAGTVGRTADAQVIVDQNAIADADRLLAWRRGYVTFDNTPLSEAVAELNRYNVRKIIVQDPAVADVRIGGSFRVTNIDAFLQLLQSGHSIAIEREEGSVILKAR